VVRYAADNRAELVVHAGDLTLDGIGDATELAGARRLLDRLPSAWVAVPGNHDIGDTPGPPALDPDRLRAWRNQIGADHWTRQIGRWTLLGLNAQLFDSDAPAKEDEEEQWAWAADRISAQPPDRPLAVIVHKPVAASEDELAAAPRYRFVSPPARRRLERLLDTRWCPVVLSVHVHQYRVIEQGGRRHVWAPTSWAVLPEGLQASVGLKRCGLLSLWLSDEGTFRADLVQPAGMAQLTLGVDLPDPYRH
jgi:3',5'-cyclic AMP phosphodiesterase CpdA